MTPTTTTTTTAIDGNNDIMNSKKRTTTTTTHIHFNTTLQSTHSYLIHMVGAPPIPAQEGGRDSHFE